MRSASAVLCLTLLSGSFYAQGSALPADPGLDMEPELTEAPLDFKGLEVELLADGGVQLSPEAVDRVSAWKLELWTRRRLATLDQKIGKVEERLKAAEKKECELKVKLEKLETKDQQLQKEGAQNDLKESKRKEKVARGEAWLLRVLVVAVALL